MGMVAPTYHTAEMVRALPDDGNRYEVVYGELLVTLSPRPLHQLVIARLAEALMAYTRQQHIGQLLTSPADISWGDDLLVQPDLFVVLRDELRHLEWSRIRTLLLAVEVLSPSTSRADRFTKRRLYQAQGVTTYWLVDPDARAIEVWTPDATFPVVERERVTWHLAGAAEPLRLMLEELFRAV
jgi:Uma2 family endonuclease